MKDYKKKYEEALIWIKDLYPTFEGATKEDAEHYFPELKESEDEKVRKEIIRFLQLPHPQFVGKRNHEEWISWLKKQREKKPAWSEEDEKIYKVVLELVISWSKGTIGGCIIPNNTDRYVNWLKSLKERMKGE